ncbi:hypothetical protein OESDEN_17976 [Oesophagostomum dentatum]|uniref:ET module n=1 Tax=Oesophagostomum dentatum TaxID=61180 RepID=A0A0B1SEK9_OESDE|nr:hypothetical protein OESDEN_17976 [Oesophagostomum dentatum]
MLVLFLVSLPLAYSLQCYDYVDIQIGGTIEKGVRTKVECTDPEYCLSVYKEGNDENVYSALCANNTYPQATCEKVGCVKSHGGGFSTQTCCCNTAYCNSSWIGGIPIILCLFLLSFVIANF